VEDGTGEHSVFARHVIDVLEKNSSVIEGVELYSKIRRSVMLNANQTPQYGDIRFTGHEGGDFLFIKEP